MSRFRNFLQEKLGKKEEGEVDPLEVEVRKQQQLDEDAAKDEKLMKTIFEVVHSIYYEYKLVGSFDVDRTFGVFVRGLSCEINGLEEEEESDGAEEESSAEEKEQRSMTQRMIYSAVKSSVEVMMKRARAYKNKKYRKDLSIANNVYVTLPVFGMLSFYISCSATCESLLVADSMTMVKKLNEEK